jgi:hypothetical protein
VATVLRGRKKSKSIPLFVRDSRITYNGARSVSDSQGIGSNNDGVDPILRAETLGTLKAGKIAWNGVSTADGSGGTTAATAASTLKANEDILSDSS